MPSNATEKGLRWYSSDETVAVVDQNGNVTGVGAGTASIYAAVKDAPLEKTTDDNGNDHFICPEGFMVAYTVNVTGETVLTDYVYGDADGDSVITASDAAFILQKTLVGNFELPAEKN